MLKVSFKVKKIDGFATCFLFADNVVMVDDHVIVSKSTDFPSFRKTVIWNIPKENFINYEQVRKGV